MGECRCAKPPHRHATSSIDSVYSYLRTSHYLSNLVHFLYQWHSRDFQLTARTHPVSILHLWASLVERSLACSLACVPWHQLACLTSVRYASDTDLTLPYLRCKLRPRLLLIISRKSHTVDWYRNQWPWMTFNDRYKCVLWRRPMLGLDAGSSLHTLSQY